MCVCAKYVRAVARREGGAGVGTRFLRAQSRERDANRMYNSSQVLGVCVRVNACVYVCVCVCGCVPIHFGPKIAGCADVGVHVCVRVCARAFCQMAGIQVYSKTRQSTFMTFEGGVRPRGWLGECLGLPHVRCKRT